MKKTIRTLGELAEKVQATLQGDPAIEITGCAPLDAAGTMDISFLANRKYASQVRDSKAAAICVQPSDAQELTDRPLLISDDPYFTFRNCLVELVGFREQPPAGIHPTAIVHESAQIGKDVVIGPCVVVEENVIIGDATVLYPHVYIGRDAKVGKQCQLYPSVTVYDKCVLGDRVTLHASCVIGQDGFGYATHQGIHHKIPQSGNAVVEDDVEMGAGCTVDRATMGSTVIGAGTKFSNSVTIGHGTKVGRGNLYVAQVGLAGSVTTGQYVVMGGQVGVAGHLKIGNMVKIAATSGVMRDVPDNQDVGGSPAIPMEDAKRRALAEMKLADTIIEVRKMRRQLAQMEKNIEALSASRDA